MLAGKSQKHLQVIDNTTDSFGLCISYRRTISGMQLLDTSVIETLHKQWPVIKAAPFSFVISVGTVCMIIGGIMWLLFRSRLARHRGTIEHRERDIARQKGSQTRGDTVAKLSAEEEGTVDCFTNPRWETVSHQAFLNETVELDGKRFYRCTFTNARLSFRGNAPCELLECELAKSVVLQTDNDAIRCYLIPERTLQAMANPEHVSVDKHGHARLIQPSVKEISAKQEALGISESDPRIYVDVLDEHQVDQITRLKLTNTGGGDAHRVQVCAVGLRTATVTFDSVGVIPSGSPALIEPSIDAYGVIQRRNLVFAMMKEWETFDDPNKTELAVPARVVYDDVQGKPLETTFDIVLDPVEEIRRKLGHAQQRPVIQTKNTSFGLGARTTRAS